MFRIVAGMGFQIELGNGYTISVMFSPSNYCSNHTESMRQIQNVVSTLESPNAEIAVIDTITGDFMPIDNEDVNGYQTVANFMKLVTEIREYPDTASKEIESEAMDVIHNIDGGN